MLKMKQRGDNYDHNELCSLAVKFLTTAGSFKVVAKEMKCLATEVKEIPDVLAFNSKYTVLIECKTSRSDYIADFEKPVRKRPSLGMGSYRYYFCEAGVIREQDLPVRWGLIWVHKDGRIQVVRGPMPGKILAKDKVKFEFKPNIRAERQFMYYMLMRAASHGHGIDGSWNYANDWQFNSEGNRWARGSKK